MRKREREGGSMARRGWSLDYNCSGKPETRNYAMYRMENCAPSIDGFCMHSGMCRPAFAAIPAVSVLHKQLKVRKHFHVYEIIKIKNIDYSRVL